MDAIRNIQSDGFDERSPKDYLESIEKELKNSAEREVPAMRIGDMVMERLRAVDDVAYVRFASVYRKFEDVETFLQEIHKMMESKEEN